MDGRRAHRRHYHGGGAGAFDIDHALHRNLDALFDNAVAIDHAALAGAAVALLWVAIIWAMA